MNAEIVTQKIKYPSLTNFDKQDTSSKYGYHWADDTKEYLKSMKVNNRIDDYFKSSILIKQDEQYDYYMPLENLYEIGEVPNCDEYYSAKCIHHGHEECEVLQNFMPENMFVPDIEFIRTISAEHWWNVYLELLKIFPEKNKNLYRFSFWIRDGNINWEFYKMKCEICTHEGFKCYPFLNVIRKKTGNIVYGDDTFIYLDNKDHGQHAIENILSSSDDYGLILPIIKIERKKKK